MYSQPEKVAVITGGTRGIGLEVLKKLLQCQMTVVLAARNPDECETLLRKSLDFEGYKDRIIIERCDIGEMNSVREFGKKIQEKFKAINILINNGELNI